jgi:AsmA family protein
METAPERAADRPRRRIGLLVVAATLVAGIAILAATFDWGWLRHPIERRVTAYTGRPFHIDGDIHVTLHRVIDVSLERVSLGNTAWASKPLLASANRVNIRVAPWPLLTGRLRLIAVDLDHPVVNLERDSDGTPNWSFRPNSPGARHRATFDALTVRDGTLRLHEPKLRTDLELKIDSAPRRPQEVYAPLVARGTGRYRSGDFSLVGVVDSPLRLVMSDRSYRIDVHARAGDTSARVYGNLTAPINPARFALQAEIRGENLADLYPLLGIAVPASPPYELHGRLERNGREIRYVDFAGKLGDSDMSGNLAVRLGGKRPFATADLTSRHLDFDDLAVLIGAPPDTGAGETANAEQVAEAAERKASPTVLPDKPYNVEKIRAMDADIRLRAASVESKKVPIRSMNAHVVLSDGVMTVRPFDLGIAGGTVAGSVRLDARKDPIATTADVQANEIELPQLFPRLETTSIGRIGGQAKIEGHGNSLAKMFATADGHVRTVMGQGTFSNLLLELAGLDIEESLKFMLEKDRPVKLRCAYADFDVTQGIMKTRSFAFDTSDTVIFGRGTVDLRDEQIDMILRPRPKDRSLVALRVPLALEGSFKHPSIRPEGGPLIARTAAAVALYALAPPAALLALVETGPGHNADCSFAGEDNGKSPARGESSSDESATDDQASADDHGKSEDKSEKKRVKPWKSPT